MQSHRVRVPVVLAVMVLVLVGPLIVPGASSVGRAQDRKGNRETSTLTKVTQAFDATATMRADGRLVVVTGPVQCPEAEEGQASIVLTQADAGAIAEGRWAGACGTQERHWRAELSLSDVNPLQPGPAFVCGAVLFRAQGAVVEVGQWCNEVMVQVGDVAAGAPGLATPAPPAT
jgi:hypothetical protein